MTHAEIPSSILIVGSGVFGLTTALSLARSPYYAKSSITVVDRSEFPAEDGSSIDTSRIIRADYDDPFYAHLAASAQESWRQQGASQLGGQGRYTENGLIFVGKDDHDYIRASFTNVSAIAQRAGDASAVVELPRPEDIAAALGTGGSTGSSGYLNKRSGWADAEASMRWLRRQVDETGRVNFVTAQVTSLLFSPDEDTEAVLGVNLAQGEPITAALTILAAGAWSASLIDLRSQCISTGQVLAYIELSDAEQAQLGSKPTILDKSSGYFIIPPAHNLLKIARHAFGYTNLENGVSQPKTSWEEKTLRIPDAARDGLRDFLAQLIPELKDRPFVKERLCWYTDTPTEDFLVTHHPTRRNLFLATGGSGHGFKFLPVLGDRIVDVLRGCDEECARRWCWKEGARGVVELVDGARGGEKGLGL